MLPLVFAALLDLAGATPAAGAIVVVAGKQIGPVKIGMSERELAQLGAAVVDGEWRIDRISAGVDKRGRVNHIAAYLGYTGQPRLSIGERSFQLEFLRHTADELVTLLDGCKRPRRGGEERLYRIWRCAGIRVEERLADGDPELNLFVY